MAHIDGDWREMQAGAWWTTRQRQDGRLTAEAISYYTDWQPAAFSDLTWGSVFQRRGDQAEEIILWPTVPTGFGVLSSNQSDRRCPTWLTTAAECAMIAFVPLATRLALARWKVAVNNGGAGRLKIAGAQWSSAGARLVAKARAAYLSDQWGEFSPSRLPLPQIA